MTGSATLSKILAAGARSLGLDLPAATLERLLAYQAELEKWNSAYNLTAIRDPEQMVVRHLLDSLAMLPQVAASGAESLLDVGAGAGLPGIALAIAQPRLQVTALDSNGKMARFMRHAVRSLGLANVEVVEARAENHGGSYELVTSRAFASLFDFFDKTAHLCAASGVWMAMKGKLDTQELAGVPAYIQITETPRLRVPGLPEDRHLVIAVRRPPPAPQS